MVCEITRDKSGTVTKISCSRGPKRCRWCGKLSTKLCDFLLTNGRTCYQAMCDDHAQNRGVQIDFCPNHSI